MDTPAGGRGKGKGGRGKTKEGEKGSTTTDDDVGENTHNPSKLLDMLLAGLAVMVVEVGGDGEIKIHFPVSARVVQELTIQLGFKPFHKIAGELYFEID